MKRRATEGYYPQLKIGSPPSPLSEDLASPIPFPVLQSLFDGLYPPGLQWYWKADFFREISDQAIDLHMKHAEGLPTPHSTMHLYPIDGAAHRVAQGDTAWRFRDANFAEVIVGVDPDPANNPRLMAWARDYWSALHPLSAGGGYVNMMMDEGDDNVKAAYRDHYPDWRRSRRRSTRRISSGSTRTSNRLESECSVKRLTYVSGEKVLDVAAKRGLSCRGGRAFLPSGSVERALHPGGDAARSSNLDDRPEPRSKILTAELGAPWTETASPEAGDLPKWAAQDPRSLAVARRCDADIRES